MPVKIAASIHEVEPASWNALAGDNPFVRHAWLSALEDSGSVGPGTSWSPAHVLVERDGALVGAAPAYVRGDSWGEYIFDWAWADGARRAGIRYYPKLTVAVPFTPATGPRLLGDRVAVLAAIASLGGQMSGSHVLFCDESEAQAAGWLHRLSFQFHWQSAGWASFDEWLGALTSRRRKEVRRERRIAREGIDIRVLRGPELDGADWRALDGFYRSTAAKMGGHAYLTPEFFRRVRSALPEDVVAVLASRGGERIAGTFNLCRGGRLYGRWWGCTEDRPMLHFECCYYALIEWCLDHGISGFEAGAQGEHKLSRGFLPTLTHSAHRLTDPRLHAAVGRFVDEEAERVRSLVAALATESPYAERAG